MSPLESGKKLQTEFEIELPEMEESTEEMEQTPKGKVKSLLRRFEVKVQDKLGKHLLHINKQVDGIHAALHSQLDKKYGGMYKILINTFLTNIESKIYNTEITVEAMKRVIKDEMHSTYANIAKTKGETPITAEQYAEGFDNKLAEMRTKVHADVEEAKKKEVQQQEEANENQTEPTPETPTEDNSEAKTGDSEVSDSTNG